MPSRKISIIHTVSDSSQGEVDHEIRDDSIVKEEEQHPRAEKNSLSPNINGSPKNEVTSRGRDEKDAKHDGKSTRTLQRTTNRNILRRQSLREMDVPSPHQTAESKVAKVAAVILMTPLQKPSATCRAKDAEASRKAGTKADTRTLQDTAKREEDIGCTSSPPAMILPNNVEPAASGKQKKKLVTPLRASHCMRTIETRRNPIITVAITKSNEMERIGVGLSNDSRLRGTIIRSIKKDSLAFYAGLHAGMIIKSINFVNCSQKSRVEVQELLGSVTGTFPIQAQRPDHDDGSNRSAVELLSHAVEAEKRSLKKEPRIFDIAKYKQKYFCRETHREEQSEKSSDSLPSPTIPNQIPSDDDINNQEQPLVGIKFGAVQRFIDVHGGPEAFRGLTTTEVVDRLIKPETLEKRESYVDMLSHFDPTARSLTASCFISHAHKYIFLNFINILEGHLLRDTNENDKNEIYIFLDIFCINQHRTEWSYEFLSKTFMSCIKEFGRTVVVMSPWEDPLPFQRTWCVYEAYCTAATNSKYEIALGEKERKLLCMTLLEDGDPAITIGRVLGHIRAESSQSFHPTDQQRIFSIINNTVGFTKVNQLLLDQYRKWFLLLALKCCFEPWCMKMRMIIFVSTANR